MSHTRATLLAVVGALAGGALLSYLLVTTRPYAADEELNLWAVLAFLTGIFLLLTGVGGLLALALHRRWPALAGARTRQRRRMPTGEAALRQGALLGVVAVVLAVLAMLQVLDVAVFMVTLLMAGLIEAFVQSRRS